MIDVSAGKASVRKTPYIAVRSPQQTELPIDVKFPSIPIERGTLRRFDIETRSFCGLNKFVPRKTLFQFSLTPFPLCLVSGPS